MITLNRAQLQALKQLIARVDVEQIVLTQTTDSTVVLTLIDLNDNAQTLSLDKWGHGRLVTV